MYKIHNRFTNELQLQFLKVTLKVTVKISVKILVTATVTFDV